MPETAKAKIWPLRTLGVNCPTSLVHYGSIKHVLGHFLFFK
jgi:hypothetical protein